MFEQRLNKGQSWENEVVKILEERGYIVMKQGYEYTHNGIMDLLIKCKDITSKFIRYKPDHVAIKENKTFFFEPKQGNSIEKDAYLVYMNFFEIGCILTLFIRNKKMEKYEVPINKLKLISGLETINSWPSHWLKIPIDNDDWIAPRIWLENGENDKYYELKRKTRGSGTSYRYFDFNLMDIYKINKENNEGGLF